jgi:hypothetical protein
MGAAYVHESARDIVDRRNVVGIDGVTQPEGIREERSAQQGRLPVKGCKGQYPCRLIRLSWLVSEFSEGLPMTGGHE